MAFQPADKNSTEQDANVASNDALQLLHERDDDKVGYSPVGEIVLNLGSINYFPAFQVLHKPKSAWRTIQFGRSISIGIITLSGKGLRPVDTFKPIFYGSEES